MHTYVREVVRAALYWLLSCLVLISFLNADVVLAAKPPHITIGFIPGENPKTLRENGLELAKILQSRIGVPVNVYISKDYTGLIDAMKEGKVDFAFFSAMTYVFAEKEAGAKVLLKKVWDGPFYYSAIVARESARITSVEKLKGKKFAFVDKKSASGFLYPQVHFKKKGIESEKFFGDIVFSGNHEESVRLLRDGKVDAIAVFSNDKDLKDSAWAQFAPNSENGPYKGKLPKIKPIWVSAPIPNDPFCVRQSFYDKYPKVAHDLMFALIELDDDGKENTKFRDLLGVSALMLATSQQYEPVREMVRELNLTLK